MKNRFTTFDLQSIVFELQNRIVGMRVLNIYDVDKKTYLIRLHKQDDKAVLLIESGIRVHLTDFEWPKNLMPSGFAMKLRKHVRQKRLETVDMLGIDRVLNFKFGTGSLAFHIVVELYDRGNIMLTDHTGKIMSLLRPRNLDEHTKYAVNEIYPFHTITLTHNIPSPDESITIIEEEFKHVSSDYFKAIANDTNDPDGQKSAKKPFKSNNQAPNCPNFIPVKKLITMAIPHLPYGSALIEHSLLTMGINPQTKLFYHHRSESISNETSEKTNYSESNSLKKILEPLKEALDLAATIFNQAGRRINKGYLFYKLDQRRNNELMQSSSLPNKKHLVIYEDFEPELFKQYEKLYKSDIPEPDIVKCNTLLPLYKTFESFNKCVDEFYSKLETQKQEQKVEQQQKTALKKLDHVKKDHESRTQGLKKAQEENERLAQLIEFNIEVIDRAMQIIQSGLAAQMPWPELCDSVEQAKKAGDPIASHISRLKLETNHMIMLLSNPYEDESKNTQSDNDDEIQIQKTRDKSNPKMYPVEIDLGLGSAYENAMAYYGIKKRAYTKEVKTIESSAKALKSAQHKTQQLLKDFNLQVNINKARRIFWFEKFYWFITSDHFLVLGGRDQQQNEILVKKYLEPGDLYVHADMHGASSIIIKNHLKKGPYDSNDSNVEDGKTNIPPKSINEAGIMALCYSSAWEAKITVGVWWVHAHQVSKTAPSGEYLTTGSFMIRGKKHYLPPLTMIMGFGIMFKLDEMSAQRNHKRFESQKQNTLFESTNSKEPPENINDMMIDGPNLIKNADIELESNQNHSDENEKGDSSHSDNEHNPETENDDLQNDFPDIPIEKLSIEPEDSLHKLSGNKNQKINSSHTTNQKQNHILKNNAPIAQIESTAKPTVTSGYKRGQKSKVKKIKEKYADQDEEERALKLQLLASSAKYKKVTKSALRKQGKNRTNSYNEDEKKDNENITLFDRIKEINENTSLTQNSSNKSDDDKSQSSHSENEISDGEDDNLTSDLQTSLFTLTGSPFYADVATINQKNDLSDENESDTILYAIPVCAPYVSMKDFKYKVKVIPGFTKRGKGAKIALSYFISQAIQNASQYANKKVSKAPDNFDNINAMTSRILQPFNKDTSNPALFERALIKAIKDNDLSRNLPSKIKIFVPAKNIK